MVRWLAGIVCLVPISVAAATEPADVEFFERRVRPMLAEHCYSCHGPNKQESDLRLDHISTILQGGTRGSAIVAGRPQESLVVEAIAYTNVDLQMPPHGRLPEAVRADLQNWIARGAPWPDEPIPGATDEPIKFYLETRRASHWAWQPIRRGVPPETQDNRWAAAGSDRFLLAKLESVGLRPAAPADRHTLIRRLFFDLLGLPPTSHQMTAFLDDESLTAYEKLVDRLLSSPHFGERWGRHWLDLVRFAETYGHEQDFPIAHAWKYRDYVIRAMNADVPYDQWVREHIAGDLLPSPRCDPTSGLNESIVGTGFWYMHQATHSPVNVAMDQADRVDNQIDVFGKAFLGLTIACARCHDHKFDAISTRDYYGLTGFLRSSRQQFAYRDPGGVIAQGVEHATTLRRQGSELLRVVLDSSADKSSEEFVRYLMAAQEVVGLRALQQDDSHGAELALEVATRHAVDPSRLDRWVSVLRDEAIRDESHPLYFWHHLVGDQQAIGPKTFSNRRNELQRQVARKTQQIANQQSAGDYILYESFDGTSYDELGWFASGQAFGDRPVRFGDWFRDDHLRLATTNAAHSGSIERTLQGTLRSPTFKIAHQAVHYRVRGRGQIRLVINQYQIRLFTPLLFNGTLTKVDTGGATGWVTQHDRIGKYVGKDAYIELIDDGDDALEVDAIWFSENVQPPATRNHVTERVLQELNGDDADAVSALSQALEKVLHDALSGISDPAADEQLGRLVDLVLRHDLLDLKTTGQQLAKLEADVRQTVDSLPRPDRVLAITDGTPQDFQVFLRGNPRNLGRLAPRQFLTALSGEQAANVRGSGRLQLVESLLDSSNPLPSRVMANRVWHHLFGRGIVASVDNFGALGQKPTHPELLDHLANEFMFNEWSVKRLIGQLVTTSAYRMSSDCADRMAVSMDPANQWIHRMPVKRLEGEAIRDAILAVSGSLDRRMSGESVPIHLSSFMGGRRPKQSGPQDGGRRRTIYVEVRRNYLSPMQLAFDFPIPESTVGRRTASNVPAQSLVMMNSPFIIEEAQRWGRRLAERSDEEVEDRIARMFELALGRSPSEAESRQLGELLERLARMHGVSKEDIGGDVNLWADVGHTILLLKEFIFVS